MPKQKDIAEAMISYARSFIKDSPHTLTFEHFHDGIIFGRMLESAEGFRLTYGEIDQSPITWVQRLGNLKVILAKIQNYFETKLSKGILTKDINLLDIAKNFSRQETMKFFELVLAVLTEAPNKEEHIGLIMKQEQKAQAIFVEFIQRILETRMLNKNNSKEQKAHELLFQLENQNEFLSKEISQSQQEIRALRQQVQKLKGTLDQKDKQMVEVIQKISQDPQEANHDLAILYEQMKVSNQRLKEQFSQASYKYQIQSDKLREQNNILRGKIKKLEDTEDVMNLYKEKYNQTLNAIGNANKLEKQIQRLIKEGSDKEAMIRKLQEKLDESKQQNYALQEKEVYIQMELERRNIRFLQLERQLKKRISMCSQDPTNTFTISDPTSESLTAQLQELSLMDIDDVKVIKTDLQRTKKQYRQIEKQNFRLRRLTDRYNKLQEEKKKLERIIYDLTTERTEQISILLSTLHQYCRQNAEYHKILKKNKLLE